MKHEGTGQTILTDVKNLVCEYLENPIGIEARRPRLSWMLDSAQRGQKQTAYRLLVASSPATLARNEGDLWDSGRVDSDANAHVAYSGKPLKSRQQCWWKVMIWDRAAHPSPWSEPSRFEMGLLEGSDWTARWIGVGGADAPVQRPAPFFRREIRIDKPVRFARAYVCGLGYYELHLNGAKVGDHVLDPGFTRYDRRVLYVTHDVTAKLRPGHNAVGAILGNGFYNQSLADSWNFEKAPWRDNPRLILQLHIEFEDGTTQVIGTDEAWKVTTGPITFDQTRSGEHYDARLELPGWDTPGYDDSSWQPAVAVSAPQGKLSSQNSTPMRITGTLDAVAMKEVDPGVWVFDFGQGFAGWAQLRVCGPAGTQITMRHSDEIDANGRLDQRHIKHLIKEGEFQTDKYTLKGGDDEVYEPRFTYHGTRYVEVTGFPGTPTLSSLRGRVVHTAFDSAGKFECSNELLNRIQHCTLWSYVGNYHSIPTDCPHREKNGWTGDAHLAAETGLFNFQSQSAYAKWMDDLQDEQRDSGELPGIVPTGGWGYSWGNGPCWDSAYPLICWYLFLYKGDVRILEAHYDNLKRYVDYLTGRCGGKGEVWIGLGDWVPPYGRAGDYTAPVTLSATGYYYVDTQIVARAAELLGKTDDAKKYRELAKMIRNAFNKRFYDKVSGLYAGGTQTALSAALYQELVEPNQRKKVVRQLAAEVRQQKMRLNAGIHGTKHILHALSDNGRADIAWKLATQTKYPSWGHWIEQGATTLWESWNGDASHNHIMYGDISAWCYKALAGIRPDPENPGFKHIIIKPEIVGDLTWVQAEHHTMYGPVRSEWRRADGKLTVRIVIPPNTTATLHLPTSDAASVRESSRPIAGDESVKQLSASKTEAIFAVESGTYEFEAAV